MAKLDYTDEQIAHMHKTIGRQELLKGFVTSNPLKRIAELTQRKRIKLSELIGISTEEKWDDKLLGLNMSALAGLVTGKHDSGSGDQSSKAERADAETAALGAITGNRGGTTHAAIADAVGDKTLASKAIATLKRKNLITGKGENRRNMRYFAV